MTCSLFEVLEYTSWIAVFCTCIFCFVAARSGFPISTSLDRNILQSEQYNVATLVLFVMSFPIVVDTLLDHIYIIGSNKRIAADSFAIAKAILISMWFLPNVIIYFWCLSPLDFPLFIACINCQTIMFQLGFLYIMNIHDAEVWTNSKCYGLAVLLHISFLFQNIAILHDENYLLQSIGKVVFFVKEVFTVLLIVYWVRSHYNNILNILSGDVTLAGHLTNAQLVVKFYAFIYISFSFTKYSVYYGDRDSYYLGLVILQIVCVSMFTLLPGRIALRNAQLSNVSTSK